MSPQCSARLWLVKLPFCSSDARWRYTDTEYHSTTNCCVCTLKPGTVPSSALGKLSWQCAGRENLLLESFDFKITVTYVITSDPIKILRQTMQNSQNVANNIHCSLTPPPPFPATATIQITCIISASVPECDAANFFRLNCGDSISRPPPPQP